MSKIRKEGETKMMALEGIKVLDLTTTGPGNFTTMILGDLGAEVILVAPPAASAARVSASSYAKGGEESDTYHWGVTWVLRVLNESLNRNKKSLTLNLKATDGRNIFHELAKKSDVIMDTFRPGVTKRLGIDYETIKEINPQIIYCAMSGYGYDGPYRDLPGHDVNFAAFAGGLDMVGETEGPPVIPMNVFADWNASLHAVIGILTALVARQKTGYGQFLEITYLESALSLLNPFHYDYLNYGTIYKRGETFYNGGNPFYDIYETKDGKYFTIGCNEPFFWENLCRVLGREDFIPHQFTQGAKKEEIIAWLKETLLTKTRDEWFDFLQDKNIPIGKVYSSDEVFTDPHVVSRHIVVEIDHPGGGNIKHVGIPFRLSETPGKVRSVAPEMGQHTQEILSEILNYAEEDVAKLKEQGAI
jgi:crotonobetainyl-CoA:carnitine CoA-transferase CaiB-like acyl-CoA transferase